MAATDTMPIKHSRLDRQLPVPAGIWIAVIVTVGSTAVGFLGKSEGGQFVFYEVIEPGYFSVMIKIVSSHFWNLLYEKTPIKGRMPGNPPLPGIYYEKAI